MTEVSLATDFARIFLQIVFIASIAFAVIYTLLGFRWWETVTGRSLMALDLAIAGTLLHAVLLIWGVPSFALAPGSSTPATTFGPWWSEILNWLSVCSLGIAGLAIIALMWQAMRFAYVETGEQRETGHVFSPVLGKLLNVKVRDPKTRR